ncbi:alpha/beta fold hydrolase [Actinoplanes sp. NBRC 103695]|uniref:alpha/beta hydrolase family protein n=1 Tax=Actinoplanes sp. NBRC 103695 TaxID=3032202 RepID=UPI0024A34E6D|nr:alpha/beta fold hydrolase [Actinoplanes sp. NBRC 103695]GLY99983.1 alpha/beta hydrolase [Actinoplanes sp. NBRC 103695]
MKLKKVAVLAAAVLAVGPAPLARAQAAEKPGGDWAGIVRESVTITMDGGWSAKGELTYPKGARGRLPVVVLLHGSGHNDMDQTLAPGVATFRSVARSVSGSGFAVLRFNKRGVVGVGPVLSDNPKFLDPDKPYEQTVRDAAAAVRFAGRSKRVDPARVFLLGHSEGTQVVGNLVADPRLYGIAKPAGVVAMGVVHGTPREVIYYQAVGRTLGQLHEEFDGDGDGLLSATEVSGGLIGLPEDVAGQFRAMLTDPATDADGDGRLAIDTEVEPVVRAAIGFDQFPNLPGLPESFAKYITDFGRFKTPAQELPRYDGPVLLVNGQTDTQTPVRGAIVADAALATAGNRDHTLITYPGVSHLMNVTPEYQPVRGNPDPAVLRDITAWLAGHR